MSTEKESTSADKQKKYSRKDLSQMTTAEFLAAAKSPYKRLLSYVKPYRGRFALGIFFGITGGLFNGFLLLVIRAVFTIVLPTDPADEPSPPTVQVEASVSVDSAPAIAEVPHSDGGKAPKTETIHPFKGVPFLANVKFERPVIREGWQQWIFVSVVCLSIPFLIFIKGMFEYLNKYCIFWVGNKVLYQVRDELFSNLLRQPVSFYSTAKQGDLIQAVYNQTRMAATAATDMVCALIIFPVSILAIMGTLLHIDWVYTLGACVVFPLCIVPVTLVSKKVRLAGGKEEEEAGVLMTTMQESFSGIKVVKANAREDFERERFNRASSKMMKLIMRWQKATEIVGPLVETVASVGMAIGLVYAYVAHKTVHDFLILNMGLMSIYPHVKGLSRMQITLQKTLLATSKIFALMDEKPSIADKPDAMDLDEVRTGIEFRNVTFTYDVRQGPAVESLNLKFEPGRSYALVGLSGSGKSTIMSMILRFYDPDEGQILVDGHDLRDYKQKSLRDQIGIVNQDVFLFHDTIAANIRYGRLNASRKELEQAAKLAHAHEFIMEKKNGYDEVIGDRGNQLSGGQAQRISIARAMLRNAPILLLDEATSALDSEAEKYIKEALDILATGKTVIAIAHRLSTVLNADEIIFMEKGRVLASGRHAELMEACEAYRNLYNLQFQGHNEDEIVPDVEVVC
ncbi:MAG TPA: ABC transporter ATP-binding protein [Verrucomicrobiales bacterium]|nr:ABC transporter ATP-binding protein [Verrucomicrobiae bacterium]MCP5552326.1 ABC transporter ATP-binding protein [Akkermansiaceae bacterium]HRX54363.1 ABC transporter ATP-binding protein [Verrucomicrobiales bacterium]